MRTAKSFLVNLHFAILILHFQIPLQCNKHEAHDLFQIVYIPAFSSTQPGPANTPGPTMKNADFAELDGM